MGFGKVNTFSTWSWFNFRKREIRNHLGDSLCLGLTMRDFLDWANEVKRPTLNIGSIIS